MQTYSFLNKLTGEIVEQQFSSIDQVEEFLRTSKNFELVKEEYKYLPIRGKRQIN